MSEFANTSLNKVRRLPDRASYDPETIYSIIDAALICHVAFVENAQPFVIPVIHARIEDRIVFHGRRPAACCARSHRETRYAWHLLFWMVWCWQNLFSTIR